MTAWLSGIVGEASAPTVSLILTIIFIVIALLVLIWLARLLMGGRFSMRHNPNVRLQVVDATSIDNRRKLVLVRRDNVEHLIVIGGQNDLVVEAGIGAPMADELKAPKRRAAPQQQPIAPAAVKPTKRAVEAEMKPEPSPQLAPAKPAAPTQAPAVSAPSKSFDVANKPGHATVKPAIAPVPAPSQQISPANRPSDNQSAPNVEIATAGDEQPGLDAEMDALINTLTTKNG